MTVSTVIAAIGLPIGILLLLLGLLLMYEGARLDHYDERKRHALWYALACIIGGYAVLALSRVI